MDAGADDAGPKEEPDGGRQGGPSDAAVALLDAGSPDAGGPCTPPCLTEVLRMRRGDIAYDLASARDGGLFVSLQAQGVASLAFQSPAGGWSFRSIIGAGPVAGRISVVSQDFVAVSEGSQAIINSGGLSFSSPAGQCPLSTSAFAPDEENAWFGLLTSAACHWRRDAGFDVVRLTNLTGVAVGSSLNVRDVWVSETGRRFFAGSAQLLVAERADGGFAVSLGGVPQYLALSGKGHFVVAVGQQGRVSTWSETEDDWVSVTTATAPRFADVWVEREGLAWLVGSDGGSSFIGHFAPDAGLVVLPTNHSRALRFTSIHGGNTGLYALAFESDAGVHVVFRVDR
jgi:hypothetical protein